MRNVELATLKSGEVFKVGKHDFIVLEQRKGETDVISKNLMAEDIRFGRNTRDYNHSYLKEVIESKIKPVIEAAVGAENLVEHEVDLTSVDMQNEFGTCRCRVRVLTFDEARKHNDLLVNKELPDRYWTLTPWSTEERGWKQLLTVVSPYGYFYCNRYCCSRGVRPFCILKSNIFVSKED